MFDAMYRQMIDMSSKIWAVIKDGYIGESTKKEIEYARAQGKIPSFTIF